jgi:hypothetical protein
MTSVTLQDLGDDIANVIRKLGNGVLAENLIRSG